MSLWFRRIVIVAVLAFAAEHAEAQTINLFGSQTPGTPIENDPSSVTLGLKFYATQAGTISGVRFYRGQRAASNYVARLYTASGTMLGSVTVSRNAGTGWLTGNFAAPISINANTTYIAAYFAPGGHYAANNFGLKDGATMGPLVAPADAVAGGNGVYCYGGSFCFPTKTYQASNYWVDINFAPTTQQPYLIVNFNPPAPSITSDTPAGTTVSTVVTTWSDGSPFSGTLAFASPYSNDAGTFAVSGNNIIIDPAGPGVGADANTTQNITIQATQ